MKNADSQRYKHLMLFKAPFRLLLTGTPLQNSLLELISLLTFIMPRLFLANEAIQTLFAQKEGLDGDFAQQRIAKAQTMMFPFVLRRRKNQVLKDLPPKTHAVRWCGLTASQQEIYTVYLIDAESVE